MSKEIFFKTSSHIKTIVGKELITDDFVAIFELVKNSVDAGAKNISVVFQQSKEHSRIWIIDDGKGMDENAILQKWLFLGYSAKRLKVEDSDDKVYAGNKGVGRFSCDLLGSSLILQSKTEFDDSVNQIEVDWSKFEEDSSKRFETIPLFYDEKNKFNLPIGIHLKSSGTVICVENLRDWQSWDRPKLEGLKRSLAKLINPFGGELNQYKISVIAEHEKEHDDKLLLENSDAFVVNGDVSNNILAVLEGKTIKFNAWIEKNEGYLYAELFDRGHLIYKVREKITYPFIHLSESDFNISFFHLNQSARKTFAHRMKIPIVQYGNLMLYNNGFRVFPVGEPGNDYWQLDRRKAQGYSRFIGTREIFGLVSIKGNPMDFKEASSRDKGFVQTPATIALQDSIMSLIKQFEKYVVGVIWQDKLDDGETADRIFLNESKSKIIKLISTLTSKDGVEILDYSSDLLNILSDKAKGFESSLQPLRKIADSIKSNELSHQVSTAEKLIRKNEEEKLEALKFAEKETQLRRAAELKAKKLAIAYKEEKKRSVFISTGIERDQQQLEDFIHQMIIYTADGIAKVDFMNTEISNLKDDRLQEVGISMLELKEDLSKVLLTSRYLTLANFRLTQDTIKEDIISFCRDHLDVITSSYSTRVKPIFESSIAEYIINFNPIEFGMVLDNLVANAKVARANKCFFNCSKEGSRLVIDISDNGRGLSHELTEPVRIFERGFTKTSGSGIGLDFCKRVIENMGGSIALVNAEAGTKFNLQIKFEKK